MSSIFCSHILAKGAYPAFRHYDKNIVLMTPQEHNEWEFGDRSHPKWIKFLIMEEELKIKYYKENEKYHQRRLSQDQG